MTSAVAPEQRSVNWQDDKSIVALEEKRRAVRDNLAATRAELTTARQVLEDGDPKLDELMAEQILNGTRRSERYETMAKNLDDTRALIVDLERKERALLLADKRIVGEIRSAEGLAKERAQRRLLAAYQEQVRKARAIFLQAEGANEGLMALDAELKDSGLGEVGSLKPLVLLARAGSSWSAVAPKPIQGLPLHLSDWLAYIDRILGE